jgi:hypothetical protein
MSNASPEQTLIAGCNLLDPVIKPYGFHFVLGASGKGSGGHFASGCYVRDDRRLELHFRHSLGLVIYHLGDAAVSHQAYLQALTQGGGGNLYPGFSGDPLDGFRHLAHDLQRFAGDFLYGGGAILLEAAKTEVQATALRDSSFMAASVGDESKRREARRLFRNAQYREALEQLESVQYPELITAAEKRMLEMCRQRVCQNP